MTLTVFFIAFVALAAIFLLLLFLTVWKYEARITEKEIEDAWKTRESNRHAYDRGYQHARDQYLEFGYVLDLDVGVGPEKE